MWELDSSGPAKWSRHVVVRLPGAALRDTAAAGALVARLLARPEARHNHMGIAFQGGMRPGTTMPSRNRDSERCGKCIPADGLAAGR